MRNSVTASKSLEKTADLLEKRVGALKAARKAGRRGGHGECAVCNHAERSAIDAALTGKVPLRMLASTFGMSTAALSRHNKNHVSHATFEQRMDVVLDRLLAKCDEFEARALEEKVDDEVFGVIDDLRQEVLAYKNRPRWWPT